MNKFIAGGCLLLSVLTLSCTSGIREKGEIGKTASVEQSAFSQEQVKPLYAQGFKLTYADQYVLADIQDPQNEESTTFHYAFVKRGSKPTGIPVDYTMIELPIRSVICMTSLQLSNFIKLGALDKVVGITSTRHLFNKEMNERLKEGKTAKIGIEGNFDNEVIMSMNPDLILVSPFKRGGYETLKDVGIPLIPHLGNHTVFFCSLHHKFTFYECTCQRFFNIYMFAKAHCQHCYWEMGMVWYSNADGINLIAHFIEHFPEILKAGDFGESV